VHAALTYPPVWYLMRATGIVSLLLLTLVVALGIATSQRARLPGQPRGATIGLHRSASLLAVVFLAVHVLTAVLDPDAAVGLVSLLVPFAGAGRPLWVGLGALAVQLVAVLVVTSLLRHRMPRRTWRGIHWLAYAAWPLALVHGIGMGSDTSTSWMLAVNLACVAVVGAALTWRLGTGEPARARPEPRQRQALSVGQSLVTSPRRVSRS
jgi:sulfoxide reductase heme-binding subunit YedZ